MQVKIADLIEDYRTADIDHQKISWNPQLWQGVWEDSSGGPGPSRLPGRETLDLVDAEVRRSRTIRRSWLRGLADGDPVTFLVATTIWGFGSFSRGPRFLRAMLGEQRSDDGLNTVITSIVEAARRSPAEGFGSLFNGRGRPRISHLGIAYGTKVLHFAGYGHAEPGPLVLDRRVWAAATTLEDKPPIPNPTRYTTRHAYQAYCESAAGIAYDQQVEPALVEYALFQHGGRVRAP